jgi:hypothetical protein
MKPTSDQIDIRSLAATKELQEYVDIEDAIEMTKLNQAT